jgi:hypothetical protein
MRRMVSPSEVHHACNIPIRTTGNQASMIDLQDQPQQGAPVG